MERSPYEGCRLDRPSSFWDEIYNIAETSESSSVDETVEFISTILGETMKFGTTSEISDATTKEKSEGYNLESLGMPEKFVISYQTKESASIPHDVKSKSVVTNEYRKKIVLKVNFTSETEKLKVMKKVSKVTGIESVAVDVKQGTLTVTGDVDFVEVAKHVRKIGVKAVLISIGPWEETSEEQKTGAVEMLALLKLLGITEGRETVSD